MSAAGEERNKKRGNPEGRTAGQTRSNATPKDVTAPNQKRGKDGASESNMNSKTPDTPATPVLPPQDEHHPLKGFNTVEVGNLLKKGFDTKAPIYRSDAQPQKPGNVWGMKGAMATGKDFWLELRKQVTAIQQTGGVSQGG